MSSVMTLRAITQICLFLILLGMVNVTGYGALAGGAAGVYESEAKLTPDNPIDKMVLEKLRAKGIQPGRICSDAVFVRRVYLDVIGTLPKLEETKAFLQDQNPKKRAALIEQLLGREEFADYWAMKWSDLLRVKSEFPVNLWPAAAQSYHHWIRASIQENKPYDQFVRELLTASGSNFHEPTVNFYRAMQSREPEAVAHAVALTFMGVRSEKWPKEKLQAMAGFFTQIGYKPTTMWKEEIVFNDVFQTTTAVASRSALVAGFPDGTPVTLTPDRDPRAVFADWLIKPQNPWFTQNIVNRVWSWLLGRGIIHEPDDARPDNPPQNPELLTWLEQQLVSSHYDLKQIYRLILNSKVYQLSSIPVGNQKDAEENFACYPIRRLDAEVLVDALCQITGTHEEYSSLIPEPFTFIPVERRSIALPDGSITSSFLEMFGRPSRDTGLESERNNAPTAQQRLHLLNSSHVRNKLERGQKFWTMVKMSGDPKNVLNNVYLTILSRYPSPEELQTVMTHFQTGTVKGRDATVDVAWALLNSPEFLYRH